MTGKSFVTSAGYPLPEGGWTWHGGEGAMIWQLMFTENDGLVTGLKRFPEEHRASLFCLAPESGEVLRDDFVLTDGEHDEPVGDGWMIGLETTHGHLLLCHAFQQGSPEHQGIWAVDPAAGVLAWSRPDLSYVGNLGDTFLVYKSRVFAGFPERDFWLIDPLNGREVEHIGTEPEHFNSLRNAAISEEERQGVLLPVADVDESGHLETIKYGSSTITVTHRMSAGAGTDSAWRSVLVITVGGRALYEDAMGNADAAPLFNSTLVWGKRLYYIKKREVLVSFPIS